MRRHLIGIFGLAFIAIGVTLLVIHGWNEGQWSTFASIGLRAGLTLCAAWLALPQLFTLSGKVSLWMVAMLAVGAILLFINPLIGGLVLGVMSLYLFIRYLFTPAPAKRSRSSLGRRPVTRPESSNAARVTAAVPWMSSLKEQTRSR